MPEVNGQEKTEQPTHKKLTEGREKGQVAKSMEINSLVLFTSGIMILYLSQSALRENISRFAIKIFSSLDVLELNLNVIQQYSREYLLEIGINLLPIFGGLFVVALAAGFSQVGFHMSSKALKPKFNKLNPVKGIKRIFFSSRSIVEVLKSLLKLIVVGGAAYIVISDLIIQSTALADLEVNEIVDFMVSSAFNLTWKIAIVYSLIAVLDFIFQKYTFKKEMMMTKEEVKEETKQTEGNPLIKSRIRRIQYMVSKNRMMQDVPKADVVITNPTHFAIALKYDLNKDTAPKVLAKGADELARKIKELAVIHNIPLHEDKELARALYKFCNVGDFIPEKLFKAVAQVLAYIYQLKTSSKRKLIV
jgi:flagellar biosynthesis protein FlhB